MYMMCPVFGTIEQKMGCRHVGKVCVVCMCVCVCVCVCVCMLGGRWLRKCKVMVSSSL